MAKMPVASCAAHFDSHHAVADITMLGDGIRAYRCGKAGPARSGIELAIAFEQGIAATNAIISP